MKKFFFAPVRAVISLSIAVLLLSFTSKDTFFEKVFSSLKHQLHLQLQPFTDANHQLFTSHSNLSFSPGTTCTNLAADAIGGIVWEDIHFDGDTSTERTVYGVAGIQVTIFNALNEAVQTTTTDTDGNYLFAGLSDNQYRVEFTIPDNMQGYTKASVKGVNSHTSVQFVTTGNCANLGVGNPSQYCDNNPSLITPCYVSGEPTLGSRSGSGDVLVSYPYAASATKADVKHLAFNEEMGTTWGIAYARTTKDVFAASMLKRHAGFGPLGIGGIYKVNHANPTEVVPWMDLVKEGVNVGTDPRMEVLPDAPDSSSHDPLAFDAVGKVGLGDMDISEDEKTLYVLNLNNNGSLIAIDIASKTISKNIPIGNPAQGCGAPEDVRPWGLSVHKGAVYIGFVCSGQIAGGGDMQFFVQKYDGTSFTTVLNESLNYEKGFVHLTYNKTGPPAMCKNWETWTADFNDIHTAGESREGPRWCRPQPILSDIAFDVDGSMVLAFMDRTGHQTGYLQATTDINNPLLGNGYIGGDILRAHNDNGNFVLEHGGKTLDGRGAGLNNLAGSVNADTVLQGPGGGEFYSGEKFAFTHQETSLGGLALFPHDNTVALNVMDPKDFYTGGTMWLSNSTGKSERVFELYNSNPDRTANPQIGTFGKAAGLGDLELSCAPAPIELGNYVWDDKNADGIQNPAETGIDGVTVELLKGDVVIATTTTQNGGQYYFTADGTTNQNWVTTGDKVLPAMEYCIRIPLTDSNLNESIPTAANTDNSTNGAARDNDAVAVDGYAKITLTTGGAGETAHEYDFGFTSNLCLGDYVWSDKNLNGIQEDGETGIDGLTVELLKNDAVVATTTTSNGGQYLFTVDGAANQVWAIADDKVLPEMAYTIRIALSQTAVAKSKLTGINQTDDLKDSDAIIDGDYAIISLTSGKPGSSEHHYDFGFQPTLCVGNLVWLDSNNNGLAENTEAGIPNVEVILYQVGGDGTKGTGNDLEVARKTTDENGNYLFTDLAEGVYFIKINSGIPSTLNSSTGSGVNGSNANSYEPGLATSTDIDNDDNGSQMGTMVMSDTFTLAICTEPITDGDTDSNTNLSVDFGFSPSLSIGNLVWNDVNNNGLVDPTEKGIPNVTVELYQLGEDGQKGGDDDVLVASMPTGNDGDYLFSQLNPGDYYVKLNGGIPTGMVSSTGQGPILEIGQGTTEPAADPNNNQNNNDDGTQMDAMIMSGVVNLTIGQEPDATDNNTNLSVDFGLYGFMCLGDYVWADKNTNGIQDDTEKGIAGIEVELVKNDVVIATTTTGAEGQYFFTLDGAANQTWTTAGDRVLATMPYTIRIAINQAGLVDYKLTAKGKTTDDKDSDADVTDRYATINLTSGAEGTLAHQYDFGFLPTLSVGNLVWLDSNNNGLAESTEAGIADVEVILYQVSGDGTKGTGNDLEVARKTTDANGNYLFADLAEGVYFIKINSGIPSTLNSSTGSGVNGSNANSYEPGLTTSTDIDNDDNGSQMGTMVMSDTFTLAICAEPATDGDEDTNTNLSVDFGFSPSLSIGNLVWNDVNNNGLVDPTEKGVPNITVELYQLGEDGQKGGDDDVLVASMPTGDDGDYLFNQLNPGDYYVKLNGGIPTGMVSSTGQGPILEIGQGTTEPAADPNNNQNNNDDGSQMGSMIMSGVVNLAIGQEPDNDDNNTNLSVDFGLYGFMCLGDYVWADKNTNGIQDDTEKGIAGIEVELVKNDVVVATTTTGAEGQYFFTLDGAANQTWTTTGDRVLAAMPYSIRIAVNQTGLADYQLTTEGKTTDDKDNDGTINGDYATINLTSGAEGTLAHQYDFGFLPTLSVGNLVWLDSNNNGIAESTENGIADVEVILYQVSGDGTKGTGNDLEVARKTTDANGNYLFADLAEGVYFIKVNSGIPTTLNSSTGSGVNGTNANSYEPGLTTSTDIDNDDNGSQMGTMVMSDTFTLAICTEPATDGDEDTNTNLSVDFGFSPSLSIGNLVWNDVNNNGLVDPTEKGVSNVTVELYQLGEDGQKGGDDDVLVASMPTGADGDYLFDQLNPGDYYVKLNGGIPMGMVSSTGQGPILEIGQGSTEPAADPNNNQNNNDDGTQMDAMIMSGVVNLTIGQEPDATDNNTNLSVDFGLYGFMCLGDYVWADKNTNGIQDDSEKGIAGIEVELVKDNQVVATTTTGTEGQYFFTIDGAANQIWATTGDRVLAAMPYSIRIAVNQTGLADYQLTSKDKTSDDKDSDADIANGYATINLTSGAEGTLAHQYDFGFLPTLSVGNLVWLDSNNNGLAESTEAGISDVEVILYQVGGDGTKGTGNDVEVARINTDRNGNYLFIDLAEGVYFIKINSGIPANLTSATGTGATGAAASSYEPGLTTSTDIDNDDNGSQMGTMVMSDTFTLAICAEPATDSDEDTNTNLSVDFGFIPSLAIGNLVWNDLNNNGIYEDNEPTISGVEVQLYQVGVDGQKSEADVLVATQVTKADGLYLFDNLSAGNYYVKLNSGIPANMISSTGEGTAQVTGSGANEPAPSPDQNETDSDDNGSQMGSMIMSDVLNLGIGQEPTTDEDNDPNTNLAVDFGLFELMALGNLVWLDPNNNGVFDKNEEGAAGVEAILFQVGPDDKKATSDDVEIQRDTTDKDGYYLFTSLLPGEYYVKLADGIPFGYGSSTGEGVMEVDGIGDYEPAPSPDQNETDNDDNGNQMNYMIMSDLVNLVSHTEPVNDGDKNDQTNLTVDFGLFQLLRLGNLVWEDYDNDGTKDADEPGIPNVEAILYKVGPDGEKGTDDDVAIATDITDADGHYIFVRLLPGDYYVKLNSGIDGFNSSTGEGVSQVTGNGAFETAPDPDNDVDNEDNGTQMGAMVMSDLITLEFMGEPSFEDNFVNSNFTLDFGLFQPLAIGNLVWNDRNNDGLAQANEPGFPNIEVILYEAGADGQKSEDDIEINRMRTDANGNYNFTNLKPGSYYVKLINISSKYVSSNGQGVGRLKGEGLFEPGATTNSDVNSDDNGTQTGNMVMSDLVSLQLYKEPINDGDADRKTNLAVDFGLVKVNEIKIYNPCTCLNNESSPNAGDGQFTETITLLTNQTGQTWRVTMVDGAFNSNNSPVVIGAVAQENGTENGQYRYTFNVRHVDGKGYTLKFTNGADNLIAANVCHYSQSCHFVISPPCADCTPGPPQPDPCLMTFIMGTDDMHRVDSLNCCDNKSTFTDDGLVDGLYEDSLSTTGRDDIFTICPQNQWQQLTYHFSEFGLEDGDTLYVYDGRTVTDSLLGKFSGAGVSKTGGWVASTCSPSKNESSCLTFNFITDGDNNKGIGWNGTFECTDRDIKLTPPNIQSPKLTCQVTTATVTIDAATITAACGTVVDSQIVRIYNAKGVICKDTCLAFDESFDEVFAIGQYRIEYKLKTDTVKTANATFAVQGAAHVCNDLVRVPLGAGCTIALTPDDLLERTCDTIPDTMYYFITVKGLDKNGQEEVIVAGGGKGAAYPVVTKEQFVKYGGQLIVDIEKRYYEDLTFNICNSGVQSLSCRTLIEIEDNSGPIFSAVTRDTFKVCDIDLTEEGLALTKPEAIDNCNEVEVVFSEVRIINDGGVCDTTRAEVIWAAVDSSGNKAVITQNIVLIRADTNDIVKPADRILTCGTDTEADFNDYEKAGIPGIKVGKVTNGVLVPSDTIDLSTEKYICGFILQKRDVQIEADCGKKLFRYWDVLDWCQPNGGPIKLDTQYINLKDVTPPTFEQDTLAFRHLDLDHSACRYDITKLANPAATDNCSAVTVSMDKVYRIENGELWEMAVEDLTKLDADSFRISWIAVDACHEQIVNDTITQDVLIQDVTKPSAVCTDKITVSIGTDAIKMHYKAFEAGSYDACGIEKYEVSRDEFNWGEYVTFDCADVHQEAFVFLRITDKNGNQNTCWMNVIVEDKIKPICSDLADQTGTCDAQHADDFGPSTDTNKDGKMSDNEWVDMTEAQVAFYNGKYGDPYCSDNAGKCNELVINQQYQLLPWPCGMLEIKRRVQAIDWMGEGNKSNWVEQKIKIEYKANWSITFPADWTGTCGADIPSSETFVVNGTCDLLAVEMEEKTFVTDEEACLKVVRTFTVINWCIYQSGDEGITIARDENEHGLVNTPRIITALGNEKAGKITYTQILKVLDDKAPVVFIQEPDSCIYALDGDATPYGKEDITPGEAPFECDELKTWTARAADCSGEENITWVSKLFKNGTMVYQGASNRIDYVVENKSTYTAEFWAYDGCGNSGGAKTEPKKFWDCKKPTPYCLNGIATELMASGMIQVWAKDLDQGSYDNCTPSHRLDTRIYHLALGSPPTTLEGVKNLPKQITLNCAYLGVQDVRIYVIDEEGNWDFCETYVNIQDNMGACDNRESQLAIVEGTIMDWKGNTLEGVQVTVANDNAMMTPNNGQYAFDLPMNADYTVTPAKDVQHLNGVSTFDLVLISKHILGITKFNNPHQYIAADVNQSGSVTAFDMVQLRRLILNLETEFTNNTSWKFVEAKYQFTTENPAAADFPTLSSVNDLAQDMQMDFTAIKIGDVNGNARTNGLATTENRSTKTAFTIETADINLTAGQQYTVDFSTNKLATIEGYQFTLGTGNLQFEQLKNGITSIDNFGLHKLDKGYITTSWNSSQLAVGSSSQQLFSIAFTATTDGKLSEQLSLLNRPTIVEAYHTDGELLDVQLNFTNTTTLSKSFEVYQNQPNPFVKETSISFFLPEQADVVLTLRDEVGRLIKEVKANKAAGLQSFSINSSDLPKGLIYYQISSRFGTQTRKMLRVE